MNDTPTPPSPKEAATSATGDAADTQTLNPSLLDILVCPLTRSALELQGQELVSKVGGLRYPVRQGVPIMLVTEAVLPSDVSSIEEFKAKYAANA